MELVLVAGSEQLKEKFSSLQTANDVANLLEIDLNTLNYHLHRVDDPVSYTIFKIPKKSGGMRSISAPSTPLKIIQQKLNHILQIIYEPRRSTHGFVLKRSIVTNARKHCKRRLIFNIDLIDFFPSINFGRVRGLFMAIPYELDPAIATILARICCFNNELPQGAPTSPIIANMICRRMDRQLEIFARNHRCAYTRYADDITFSTSKWDFPVEIVQINASGDINVGTDLSRIINENGFNINPEKVRLRNHNQRQEVTGLTTNIFPNVQRKYVRNIRAMLYAWDKFGLEAAEKEYMRKHCTDFRGPYKHSPSFEQIVKGKINFLAMVKGKDDPIYLNCLRRYEKLILKPILENLELQPITGTTPESKPEIIPVPAYASVKDIGNLLLSRIQHSISPTSISSDIPISTRKNLSETKVNIWNIENKINSQPRVCLVQLDYSLELQKPPMEFGYVIANDNKEIVKQKVFAALNIARDENVNIMCFPELGIDKEWLDLMQADFKDIIIIAGSHYRDRYNTCPVLISGKKYLVHKINPSTASEGNVALDRGMVKGDTIHIFQTRFGSFMVLICIDYLKEFHRFYDNQDNEEIRVDMVINPSCNRAVNQFQSKANYDCAFSSKYPYILQTNILKLDDDICDGTCIIGIENNSILRRYQDEGYRTEGDQIKYKLLEADKHKESIIIANLEIERKGEILPANRLKMHGVRRYIFENSRWSLVP